VTSPELSDRHPATQHLMGILRPNPALDGIAADVSAALFQAACDQVTILRDGPELSDGLRKLWEAKNCLVMQGLIDSGAVIA
jgi:hypothetical protein